MQDLIDPLDELDRRYRADPAVQAIVRRGLLDELERDEASDASFPSAGGVGSAVVEALGDETP